MPRYTFCRRSIVEEIFTVQASNEQEAHVMVNDGHPMVKIEQGEWVDWADDDYILVDAEDEIVTFIRGESVNG